MIGKNKAGKIAITAASMGALILGLSMMKFSKEQWRQPAAIVTGSPLVKAAAPHEKALAEAGSSQPLTGYCREYFERTLLGTPVVAAIYGALTRQLPDSDAALLAAIYVAEGPVRNGSPGFARFISALHEEIRTRSNELAELLSSHESTFRQDPFVYQMALNLAFNLAIPPEAKARLLGNALSIPFTRDPKTGVTLMTANITNALILMKNSGVTLEQALPYIRQGLAANSANPDAYGEFVARVNTYYPGAI